MEVNRPYISFSQYTLFISSPKAYYEKYGEGKVSHGTKYQSFGKRLMEDLEFGTEIKGIPTPLKNLVKSGIVEYEMTVESKHIEKDLFGIVDVIQENYSHFSEIKTGKHPWTESKVKKDEQMLFYALMINLKHKIIPVADLVWAETRDTEDGGIIFTGQVKVFRREFTLEELVDFAKKVNVVVKNIAEYEHTVFDVDSSVDARLLTLMTEKKRIDAELDLLKAELTLELKEFSNKYASSENFNITLAKRTSYKYSDKLTSDIKASNENFKMFKYEEEKSGLATPKITEYLVIKPKK